MVVIEIVIVHSRRLTRLTKNQHRNHSNKEQIMNDKKGQRKVKKKDENETGKEKELTRIQT
jgi:hypothetical protein